jgi:hypothetical protein
VNVDAAVMSSFTEIMGNEKLSAAERGQALLDLQFKNAAKGAEDLKTAIAKAREADLQAVKTDQEFGGVRFEATVKASRSALAQFGGEELSKVLTEYGIDNHPAIVKAFARVRAAIAEDTVAGKGGTQPVANDRQSQLQARYNKSPKMFGK